MVTFERPHGTLFISDLELAAFIADKDVLAQHHPVAERAVWMAMDNCAALSCSTKGSATATSARAYLLRLNSLHQRTITLLERRTLCRQRQLPLAPE